MKERFSVLKKSSRIVAALTLTAAANFSSIANANSASAYENPMHIGSGGVQPYQDVQIERILEGALEIELAPPNPYPKNVSVSPRFLPLKEIPQSSESQEIFYATHYGEFFNGRPLGCGNGVYSSEDESILAVPISREPEWPCGTPLTITNPASGASIDVVRQDSCGGCSPNTLDLSEAGIRKLCGYDCSRVSGLTVTLSEYSGESVQGLRDLDIASIPYR